jgi:hypothetical protein
VPRHDVNLAVGMRGDDKLAGLSRGRRWRLWLDHLAHYAAGDGDELVRWPTRLKCCVDVSLMLLSLGDQGMKDAQLFSYCFERTPCSCFRRQRAQKRNVRVPEVQENRCRRVAR